MNGSGVSSRLKSNSKGRRILFFSGGATIVLALIITAVIMTRTNTATRGGLFTVKKADFRIVITEDGVLGAKESQKVIADVEAQAKIVWLIDEGSFVTKGAKLVELDKTELEAYLENLELDLITLDANYRKAQEDRRKYINAEYPQQLKKLKFDKVKAQARLDKATDQQPKKEHEHLYSKGELRDAKLAVEEAQMNLETAELALEVFEKYTHPRNLLELDADFEKAKRLYEKQKEQETKVAAQVKKMELYAPSDGLVIYGGGAADLHRRRSSSTEEMKVGTNVYKGQVVMTLPNVTKMLVAIKIHEVDIVKVKKGLSATIRVHAFRNQEFKGVVGLPGVLARERDGWRSQGVKVFDVPVDITGKHTRLRPGLTARVDILVKEVPGVLKVPVEAVRPEPGKGGHYCWVKTPSGPRKRRVKTGDSNNSFVVITEGLKEGDQVYQYDPTAKNE